ncbi:Protein ACCUMULATION AND REPLICATION OF CHLOROPLASTS 3, chloroplastic [Linum perenne]
MATDLLLKNDTVTLDEALRTADTAVSLAIKAISLVVSPQEMHKKLIDEPRDHMKGLAVSSILKNLENQKEAKIGFGVGNSIRDSVMQALYDCPFIGTGIKNSNGMVFCIITSSDIMEDEDLHATLDIFRQTLQFTGKVVIASSHEPNLEPNMLVTSIIVIGSRPQTQALPKKNIFSTLAEQFPSILKFFMGNQQLEDSKEFNTSNPSKTIHPLDTIAEADVIPLNGMADGADRWHEDDNNTVFRGLDEDFDFGDGIGDEDPLTESSGFNDHITEGSIAFQRELLQNGNLGLGHLIAEKWAKQRARTPILDNLSIFPLPVGVRRPEDSGDIEEFPDTEEQQEGNEENAFPEQLRDDPSISSLGALTDAGFLAVKDFYSYASTLLKSRNDEAARKQGVLSVRAASVLESERDSPRKWSPTTEMQYRGGVYKGRCQGGLPEGKGRLVLHDGSIYDGMWHYGKRSGLGAFYFSNGDVFQGSWRDDVMHGKGWFYFHTGDRWFANFWKGKANGESRFYSKLGDVFFGQFQDGWRQGDFLCVDVEGTRCIEVWNKGVLVSRKPLDSDNAGG